VRPGRSLLDLVTRGAALLYGTLAWLAVTAELRGTSAELSLWWIDLRDVAAPIRLAFLVLAGGSLLAWALRRDPGPRLRAVTGLVALAIAIVATRDTLVVLDATRTGLVRPGIPVPLSAPTAVAFAGLAVHAAFARLDRRPYRWRGGMGLAVVVVAWGVAFPLLQMAWFGTTDYRRPAEAAVVFGARVYASGSPSPLLSDRLRTGIELYREGLVARLVMSGGDGADGFNEARVMAEVAVAGGVPRDAVLVDEAGITTEATVANSLAILEAAGVPRGAPIVAVSQAYHLPRVQLAYSDAGIDVLTVPAPEVQPIRGLPLFIAREVPAFWSYLLGVCLW
jgi:vancomycin permeability regulator SanA